VYQSVLLSEDFSFYFLFSFSCSFFDGAPVSVSKEFFSLGGGVRFLVCSGELASFPDKEARSVLLEVLLIKV